MNDILHDIVLSSNEFKMLENELKDGKMAKSILLISKDEKYSFYFAKLLSCLLFDRDIKDESENYIKVFSNSHPDLKIYPSKGKLLVQDSEDIVFESAVKPIFADKKIFIINKIEESMEAAQNKLLKTLEEPLPNVYFILTTKVLSQVLPTIRSRCTKIELGKIKDIEKYMPQQNKTLALALSDGYIGFAQKYASMENLDEIFNSTLDIVTKLKSSKNVLKFSTKLLAFENEKELIFEILSLIFEDLLYLKNGKQNLMRLKTSITQLESVEREYTVEAIIEIEKLINKAMLELSYNCNFNVVIENLILNILEVKYLCK